MERKVSTKRGSRIVRVTISEGDEVVESYKYISFWNGLIKIRLPEFPIFSFGRTKNCDQTKIE